MATGPSEQAAFRRMGAPLWFTINGLLRGAVVGAAAGLTFALSLTVSQHPGRMVAVCVMAASVGAVLGAAVGGVIALTGYGRPRWLPVIGGVVAAYGWLAWDWLDSRGQPLSDWAALLLLVLPFAAAAGVLHGIWLRKLRMRPRYRVTRSSTD